MLEASLERQEVTPVWERLHDAEKEFALPVLVRVAESDFLVIPKRSGDVLDKGKTFVYQQGELARKATVTKRATIGREEGSDFRQFHQEVSRRHGAIEPRRGGRFVLVDHSRNGTWWRPVTEFNRGRIELQSGERTGPFLHGKDPVNIILGRRVLLQLRRDQEGVFLEDVFSREVHRIGEKREPEAVVRLGKGPRNDMTFKASPVSGRHAELTYLHGVYYLADLQSKYGTELWRE